MEKRKSLADALFSGEGLLIPIQTKYAAGDVVPSLVKGHRKNAVPGYFTVLLEAKTTSEVTTNAVLQEVDL